MPAGYKQSIYDCLIVGQGLAGTCISWQLYWKQIPFIVADPGHESAATRVAAGLINPLSGPRLHCHEQTQQWFQSATQLYQQIEQQLKLTLLTPVLLHRLLATERTQKAWATKQHNPLIRPWIAAPVHNPFAHNHSPAITTKAAILDAPLLISSSRKYFLSLGVLKEAKVDPNTIAPAGEHCWQWQGHLFRSIIWCQGWEALHNPLLKCAELTPVKGDILHLQPIAEFPDHVHHWGHWAIPRPNGLLLGATYTPGQTNLAPDPHARRLLLDSFYSATHLPAQVTAHLSGIRPVTRNHQPLCRWTDSPNRWGLFNGFGSHGSLRIPHASREFLASSGLWPQ